METTFLSIESITKALTLADPNMSAENVQRYTQGILLNSFTFILDSVFDNDEEKLLAVETFKATAVKADALVKFTNILDKKIQTLDNEKRLEIATKLKNYVESECGKIAKLPIVK